MNSLRRCLHGVTHLHRSCYVKGVWPRYFLNSSWTPRFGSAIENPPNGLTKDCNHDHSALNNTTPNVSINADQVPGTPGDDSYAMVFTCTECNTRAAKKFSKRAYHHGVVVIKCPGCLSMHLVADNINWLRDNKTNIEMIMKEKGEDIVLFKEDLESRQFSPQDTPSA